MDKNYYEILEVDRNASPEVIEKAYKTLVKKYHPDLQDDMNKSASEEILKKINEAYDTLTDPTLKSAYDAKLDATTISQEKYNEMYQQNQNLKDRLHNLQQHMNQARNYNQSSNSNYQNSNIDYNAAQNTPSNTDQNEAQQRYKRDLEYEQQINQARQKAYHDAYIQDLKNRGYKIRYKKTFSDYVKGIISIAIVIFVLYLVWHIPFVQNYFIELYHSNSVIRILVNIFRNIFNQ